MVECDKCVHNDECLGACFCGTYHWGTPISSIGFDCFPEKNPTFCVKFTPR